MAVDAQELIIHPNSYCSLDHAKVFLFTWYFLFFLFF